MQLREILRIKGNLLVTIAPDAMVSEGDTLIGVLSFHDVARAVLEEEQAFENRMLKGYIKDLPA